MGHTLAKEVVLLNEQVSEFGPFGQQRDRGQDTVP